MPCEEDDKCCRCIDIATGIKVIGVITIIGFMSTTGDCIQLIWNPIPYTEDYQWILLVPWMILLVPSFFASVMFLNFFRDDSTETRANLPKACLFAGLSYLSISSWIVVCCWMYYGDNYSQRFSYGFGGFVWYIYFF